MLIKRCRLILREKGLVINSNSVFQGRCCFFVILKIMFFVFIFFQVSDI